MSHYGNVTIALCTSYEEDQFYLSHTSTHGWYTYVISHTPHLADKQIYIISHLISHISDTYSYVIYCIWHTPHMADVYFTNSTKGWYKDQAGPSTDSLFCFCCLLICCLKSIQIYNIIRTGLKFISKMALPAVVTCERYPRGPDAVIHFRI